MPDPVGTLGTSSGASMGGSVGTGIGGGAGTFAGAAGEQGQECTLGEVRCDELIPQRCSELGRWVATHAACAVGCYEGECVACAAGDRECRDGAVQECEAGSWGTFELCENACEAEVCVEACTEGRYQCNGERWLQQCTGGEYVDHTECEFLCSDGECTGECMPDARRCNPDADNESQSCNGQGHWDQSESCEDSGTYCVAGDCRPCRPGTKQCSESGPQLCSDAGEWVNQGACTSPNAACFEGDCVLCTPGEKRCTDNAVEECLPDGSGFEVIETCSGESPACLEATRTCGKCGEGTSQCFNDQVQTCDDEGAWQTSETCSGTTPQCVDSGCAACDPATNERRCQTENSAQGCSADGSWAPAESCTGDTPVCREDLNFACGCEEGARRCRNTTVPELCDGGAWVAQATCTGELNYCLPETGECVDCVPEATECRSGVAHECSGEGAWQSLDSCAGPGINCAGCDLGEDCGIDSDCDSGFCVDGVCAVCEPGEQTCEGDTPLLCSETGNWDEQTTCSGNTPACLPSSGECVQCSSGSRACGTCDGGTQSCTTSNQWGTCEDQPDLQTSNQHCGSCGNACSTGKSCQSGSCQCNSGTHACDASCFSNTDADHCGSSCHDCSDYVGTTDVCSDNQCACEASSLACGATVPTCGSWDFNSNTLEGWAYGTYYQDSSAAVGELGVVTINGSPAVTAEYDNTGDDGLDRVEFRIEMCPNGAILNLSNYVFSYDVFFKTGSGVGKFNAGVGAADAWLISDGIVNTGCTNMPASDVWTTYSCLNMPSGAQDVDIVLRVNQAWRGDIYIDNVKITPE